MLSLVRYLASLPPTSLGTADIAVNLMAVRAGLVQFIADVGECLKISLL